MKTRLKLMFREWWNQYLTIECFAEAKGLTKEVAYRMINIGRKLHNIEAGKLQKEPTK